MDRISRCSRGAESIRFGDLRIASLLFANKVVLLASSDRDLQQALGRFVAECEAVKMRVSTFKTEAMVLCCKPVDCSLPGSELLSQVRELKYLEVLSTSEGKMEREMDRLIGAAAAVMRPLYRTVGEERAEPEGKALNLPVDLCSNPHLWS